MSGGIISFTLMAIAGREASFELDTFEILLYRSIIGFITVMVIAKSVGTLNQIKTQILKQHFYRNIAHFSGQRLWLYALSVIPLAQVLALEFTLPLWVVIFSSPLLGEKITRIKATSVLIGFIGILVIARPNIDTLNPGVLTAALSAVGFAFTVIFTKRLTTTESITCILFYLTSMQLIFGLIAAGLDGIVCSAKEAKSVKRICKNMEIITPSIRLVGDNIQDQNKNRVVSPKSAFKNGATAIVIGRGIAQGSIKNNLQKLIKSLN